jgi:hypothetical protein
MAVLFAEQAALQTAVQMAPQWELAAQQAPRELAA